VPIEVKNISYIYDQGMPFEKKALDDVSITIKDASITGIIGSTGSGKSTLIQHFNALLVPTMGEIVVDGIETKKWDKKALRRKVGLVFQYPEAQLFGETVFADIAFGPQKQGLKPDEVEERVLHALKLVGLDPSAYRNRSPFKLSGGEKRKVAIAGVLACHPEIIVLDEPTAGLDPVSRKAFLELVVGFKKEGHTLVMVSHDMDEVAGIAQNVIIMGDSRIIFEGATDEAFSQPDLLISAGLDVPALSSVAHKLRNAGFSLPRKTFNAQELAKAIVGQLDEQ